MCTLSFIPKEKGFVCGMNRDELLTREVALAPRAFAKEGVQTLYPRETGGGTWIACNSGGVVLALLNWNGVGNKSPVEKARSRGTIIPELIGKIDSGAMRQAIARLDLQEIRAFRLMGIFGSEKTIVEWRWDGARLETLESGWASRHWFSSSLSDGAAEQGRGATCEQFWKEPRAGTEEWLRGLHRSHVPEPGPFSVCVHRPDAATVSYTEVKFYDDSMTMNYAAGNPCRKDGFDETCSVAVAAPHRA